MEFKDYQQGVVDTFDAYLGFLKQRLEQALEVDALRAKNPKLKIPALDFCGDVWTDMRADGRLPVSRIGKPYSARLDGVGRAVPNVCLKIPTGGGKTLLAVAAISRLFAAYVERNTGFVLWIVPNEAIYTQTKKQLTDRDHPYRQMLDRAGAGRVKIFEKETPLDRRDVDSHLCIMLLMLQSANRETKDTLRLFRDRGNVHGFFPDSDDIEAHYGLLQTIPNLDAYADQDKANKGSIVKDSLGNVLRAIRPVVIVDEGHKAYSKKALETVFGFNPCFVLELSATPKDRSADTPPTYANWLVDVRGSDLAREDMIKLPINVKVKAGDDWRDCLRDSVEHLNKLAVSAEVLRSNSATYIRPILLVQVQRTGNDQREAGLVHAEDAREFLLKIGVHAEQIAVKTSEVNDLNDPENLDLLSRTNPIRFIITKQALQEGWDCPFAYVLCSLAASSNVSAMTQLIGRILRQPYARKTGLAALDECYVFCHHAETRTVVDAIKAGLEQDGMADLASEVKESQNGSNGAKKRNIQRRKGFDKLEIYLPVVNWVHGKQVRPLDYEADVLMAIEWGGVDLKALADTIPTDAHLARTQMTQISFADGKDGEFFQQTPTTKVAEGAEFDPVYATRIIADIVPNPWIAREMVGRLLVHLINRKFTPAKIGEMSSFILEELRRHLIKERDALAEAHFFAQVAGGSVQFKLRTDTHNWRMPVTQETDLPERSPRLLRKTGDGVEKSLFAPTYRADFNNDEEDFACYLDEQKALTWWHRNVAKTGQYCLQGWRKNKVYPDFIFAVTRKDGTPRIAVIETKGDQLDGNLDTAYKRKLLTIANQAFGFDKSVKAGELELVIDAKTMVSCELILMSEWKSKIPNYVN